MARKKKVTPQPLPESWVVSFEYDVTSTSGKVLHLSPGTLIGVKGERGRFAFAKHVLNTANGKEWIDVIGGAGRGTKNASIMFRSFRPEIVTRIYKDVLRRKK